MDKIKLSKFWSPETYAAVRCKNKKEAEIFIKACINIGEKSFSLSNMPYYFGEKTPECLSMVGKHEHKADEVCFSNEGCFDSYKFYKNRNFNIYEFEDIDFNQTLEENIIADITTLLRHYDCDMPEHCAEEIYNKFIKKECIV